MAWIRRRVIAWSSVTVLATGALGCPDPEGTDSGSSTSTTGTDTTTTSDGSDSSSGTSADSTTGPPPGPLPARLGVTADWLARSLTVIDLDALAAGASTRDEIAARTIDLSAYAPGPLQVELLPDGTTALASISPGFYGGFVGGVIGAGEVEQAGTLLMIDLPSEAITEIVTTHVPMGIAIDPDGALAYTANYGLDDPVGSTLSVIDLQAGTELMAIEVGDRPEQVSLNAEGTLGILNVVSLGAVRVFQTDDPAGTLSDPLPVGADPSDVDFLSGTPYAIVANSFDPSNYVFIDVGNPMAPVVVAQGAPPLGSYYAATAIPGTADAVLTASDFVSVFIHRARLTDGAGLEVVWEYTHAAPSFPLGVALSPADGLALVAAPGTSANTLIVQDLDSPNGRQIPWLDEIGPTYVAVAPGR